MVAGGTGLVGTNLTKKLKDLGADVSSSYFSKPPFLLKEIYKQFDFTKFEDCLSATKGMDYVIICAAQSFGAKTMKENPGLYILPNLKINANLLEACRINKVEKVIFTSSSTVYQETDYPIKENELDLNKPPYEFYFGAGWLNRYIEQLAKFYCKFYEIKIGILRPINIYGPFDKFDDEKSNVIPALIKRALKKENPFAVWGDGSAIRDFIYVDDFIDDLLDVLDKYCVCDPVNVGSGEKLTIKAIVDVILDICGHKIIPQYDKTKPTGIAYRVLNLDKFESLFGKKKRTPFKEGILNTVNWYKSLNAL